MQQLKEKTKNRKQSEPGDIEAKTFTVVTSVPMALALTVAVLSIIGIAITGRYPGIIV